jgi:hypothetical protein
MRLSLKKSFKPVSTLSLVEEKLQTGGIKHDLIHTKNNVGDSLILFIVG